MAEEKLIPSCSYCGKKETERGEEMDFDKWLNDFCIDNFHFSYDALVGLSSVEGRVVRTLVNAIREKHMLVFGKDVEGSRFCENN